MSTIQQALDKFRPQIEKQQERLKHMGMFDDELKPFKDHFEEGQLFLLEEAKIGNPIPTEYGNDAPAMLKIDGVWYSAFGTALVSQIQRMERGDLPARVAMVRRAGKDRNRSDMKLLVTAEQLAEQRAQGEGTPEPQEAF